VLRCPHTEAVIVHNTLSGDCSSNPTIQYPVGTFTTPGVQSEGCVEKRELSTGGNVQ
jgi:hypothetical protein